VQCYRDRPWGLVIRGGDLVRFLELVNARQRVYLTPTRLRGRFAPRICVLSFRTHRERMEMALEDIEAARREVLK